MEQEIRKKRFNRSMLILVVTAAAVITIFFRFAYIQSAKEVQGEDLQELLESRWSQERELPGTRGSILDRSGEVLAEEIPSYTITAVLDDRFDSYVEEPAETAAALASVLEADQGFLEEQLSRDSVQVELGPAAKNMSYELMTEIEEMDLDGILFREDPRRYYPNQEFASHVIGYTERDMSEARMGLEESMDEHLSDSPGSIQYKQDGRGRQLAGMDEMIEEPVNGDDLVLTLDGKIQMVMEQTMNQIVEEYEPERITAVTAHAKTGEILGIANRPSFNPNEYENIENFTNYAVTSRIEPGSTMKMFTLAGAVEEGVYDGEDTFESGSIEVYDRRIRDHNNGEGWGEITFNEGVQRSSNVAFTNIAQDLLKPEGVYHYIDQFGFRNPTGIDLPHEVDGGSIAEAYPIDAVTTAFGQATAVTPMQMVQAATAIANDGQMMQPYTISGILDSTTGEAIDEREPTPAGQPISAETAETVRDILTSTVEEEPGTGQPFAIDGFEVAGKTGTAQIVGDDGRYMTGHGNNLYSFLGMAPAEDPEVIVYVAVDRPDLEDHESGGQPVAEIFRQVMEQSLQYMNINPDPDGDDSVIVDHHTIPSFTGEDSVEAADALREAGVEVISAGSGGQVERQSHAAGETVAEGEKVILYTGGEIDIPDFTGWSRRSVQQFAETVEREVTFDGSGYVTNQDPAPGAEEEEALLEITLQEPGEEETDEDEDEAEEEQDGNEGENSENAEGTG
ncbi:penicillin-binding protein [Alkalicoccus chagannorensis]|uniref:penicillin-binding protein n=1 Tax=Alkalicoccus chagannorensis TaxID=427072 RepID=UPI00040217B1|nr:penicillin-binding protein [Alkalicoccus chagannorensis]